MTTWIRNTMLIVITASLIILCLPMHANAVSKATFQKSKPKGVMATAVKTDIAITWEKVDGATGYRIYEKVVGGKYKKVADVTSRKLIRNNMIRGVTYRYYVKAYMESGSKRTYSKKSKGRSTTVAPSGTSTIKNFLRSGLAPMGSTMYVWGGGWNKADTGSGKTAVTVGTHKQWRTFAKDKTRWYNYNYYRYQINDGLDCSGYVGWLMYQTFNTKNNKKGYVDGADVQGENFAKMGLGTWKKKNKVKTHKAGDIMSGPDHIWISLGECKDGSTVVLHSSPAGVKLSGTYSKSGTKNSQAAKLARKYMKKYYKSWYAKFPDTELSYGYNTDYGQFRFNSKTMSDPEGYRSMTANEVLADLFDER